MANGWRGIVPLLAEEHRTIHNTRFANGRTLTGHHETIEKIADQYGATIEEVIAAAMEKFELWRKAEKELETKIIRFSKR